jgi:hypothetical protein
MVSGWRWVDGRKKKVKKKKKKKKKGGLEENVMEVSIKVYKI